MACENQSPMHWPSSIRSEYNVNIKNTVPLTGDQAMTSSLGERERERKIELNQGMGGSACKQKGFEERRGPLV